MALNIGDRLGHDDVTALIGEGEWGRCIAPPTRSCTAPPITYQEEV